MRRGAHRDLRGDPISGGVQYLDRVDTREGEEDPSAVRAQLEPAGRLVERYPPASFHMARSRRTSAVAPCCCEATHPVRPFRLSVPLWGWATGTSPITRSVAVSMISARFEPQPETSTRLPSPEIARP